MAARPRASWPSWARAIAAAHLQVPVLGVAPGGRVTWRGRHPRRGIRRHRTRAPPQPFHPRGQRCVGRRTPLLFEVVEAIADPSRTVALVAGGGPGTVREVASAVRRGIPVIALRRQRRCRRSWPRPLLLARRTACRSSGPRPYGDPRRESTSPWSHPTPTQLAREPPPATPPAGRDIATAWRQYRVLARTARQQQRAFGWYQNSVLALGLLATGT